MVRYWMQLSKGTSNTGFRSTALITFYSFEPNMRSAFGKPGGAFLWYKINRVAQSDSITNPINALFQKNLRAFFDS